MQIWAELFGAPAQEWADRFDLAFRVGFQRDVSYGNGTVPVVFWNPRVVSLD